MSFVRGVEHVLSKDKQHTWARTGPHVNTKHKPKPGGKGLAKNKLWKLMPGAWQAICPLLSHLIVDCLFFLMLAGLPSTGLRTHICLPKVTFVPHQGTTSEPSPFFHIPPWRSLRFPEMAKTSRLALDGCWAGLLLN